MSDDAEVKGRRGMDPLLVVSAGRHASMPPERWSEYLERKNHKYLPELQAENELYGNVQWLLNNMNLTPEAQEILAKDEVYRSGRWSGL